MQCVTKSLNKQHDWAVSDQNKFHNDFFPFYRCPGLFLTLCLAFFSILFDYHRSQIKLCLVNQGILLQWILDICDRILGYFLKGLQFFKVTLGQSHPILCYLYHQYASTIDILREGAQILPIYPCKCKFTCYIATCLGVYLFYTDTIITATGWLERGTDKQDSITISLWNYFKIHKLYFMQSVLNVITVIKLLVILTIVFIVLKTYKNNQGMKLH